MVDIADPEKLSFGWQRPTKRIYVNGDAPDQRNGVLGSLGLIRNTTIYSSMFLGHWPI